MAKTTKNETVEIKGKGEKSVLEALQAQPKMPIMIPVNENMEALLVSINGCIFAIPRGQLVQVPQSVYEVVQESLMKSLGAKAKIKVSNSEA